MKNLYKYVLTFAAAGFAAAGCTGKFEEYNTNPYEPETLPVTSFFPGMIDCLASPEENPCQRNNTFWSCFGGYVTAPNSWSRNTLFATFNVDDSWNAWTVDWYFTTFYSNWFSVQRFTGGEGYYYQMAQLLKVYVMSMVTSLQGPMPYSKVANGEFYVGYDDEQTAWHAMFDDLDAAIEEINAAILSGSTPLSSVDRVYDGDNSKWLKFANTLKLRMAMRISGVDADYAKEKAEEAVASGVMESADDCAYDNLNSRYPNGYYQVGESWGGEVKANACITSYMNGYSDPRREKYFTAQTTGNASADTYMGVRSGIANVQKATYSAYSGLNYDRTDPMPIMYASEAWFLRAEGALKGWNMDGEAKTLYEEGVRTSFDEWGASGADSYLTDATSVPADYTDAVHGENSLTNKSEVTIAWDESVSTEKKLEKIITQKWIANYPNGLEGWSDFRRTGYPYLFPPKSNRSGGTVDDELGQRRLRFTETEYNNNSDNVTAAVQMLSNKTDADYTDLWWAQDEKKY